MSRAGLELLPGPAPSSARVAVPAAGPGPEYRTHGDAAHGQGSASLGVLALDRYPTTTIVRPTRTLLRLQRSAGNQAVSRLVAGPPRRPRRAPSRTAVQRGSGGAPPAASKPGVAGPAVTTVAPPAARTLGIGIGRALSSVLRPRVATGPAGQAGTGASAIAPGAGSAPLGGTAAAVGSTVTTPGGAHISGPAAAGPLKAPPLAPEQDPKFRAVKARAQGVAGGAKAHASAGAKVAEVHGAAAPPSNDATSQGAAAQVEDMSAAKPGTFDKAAFMAAVRKAIEATQPKNLDDADKFKASGKTESAKGELKGIVGSNKEGAQGEIKGATQAPPDPGRATAKPVTPLEPETTGPPPQPVPGAAAMPSPQPPAATDLSKGPAQVEGQMVEAGVTDDQLKKGNEPEFEAAVKAKDEARTEARTAPAGYRAEEHGILSASKAGAATAGQGAVAAMVAAKRGAAGKVGTGKDAAKAADEKARAEVATAIEQIYGRTKTDVTKSLEDLDKQVDDSFEAGEKVAREHFETYVGDQMLDFKLKRYFGPGGGALWIKDQFMNLPPEVNAFYDRGRANYLREMDGVISSVADQVGAGLAAARNRIAVGRAEISKYVAGLSPALRSVGLEAQTKFQAQFDELAKDVDSKQEELVSTLAQKYVESRDAIDARITALQEENKGLVDAAKAAVSGAIETIKKLKAMLEGVLARAAGAVDLVVKDPIKFLGNLGNAVVAGLKQFVGNIATHLKAALMGWLFGTLAEAGVTLPEKFDLKGILGLVLQIIGLTYANIRARVAKAIGEPAVARMEKVVEVFKILVSEGVGGLWKFIKGKLGELKSQAMEAIKGFLIEKVIVAGVTWLISLLNPASAFVKACKAIYDVIMFFVERGEQIMALVNTIIDSVTQIASGALGSVAGMIEGVLAKGLPLAISFLASLLGLGGIAGKIKSIIEKIQGPVNKLIDWVVNGAVKLYKKTIGKLIGKGVSWAKGKVAAGRKWVRGKVDAGKKWASGKLAGAKKWFKGKAESASDWFQRQIAALKKLVFRDSFDVDGEAHSIFTEPGNPAVAYVASGKKKVSDADLGPALAALNDEYKAVMTDYWATISQKTGGKADKALIRQAGKLRSTGKALIKRMVAAAQKAMRQGQDPGMHAPHIGEILAHRSQGSRLRPKKESKNVPAWRMESEHTIPREVISGAFSVLPLKSGSAITDTEYKDMDTILMYADASKQKTHGNAGDLATIRTLKGQVGKAVANALAEPPSKRGDVLGMIGARVMQTLGAIAVNASGRAMAAIKAEQSKVGDARAKGAAALPTDGAVDQARGQQLAQIEAFFDARIKKLESLREKDEAS